MDQPHPVCDPPVSLQTSSDSELVLSLGTNTRRYSHLTALHLLGSIKSPADHVNVVRNGCTQDDLLGLTVS
jgi:hypothetical protein